MKPNRPRYSNHDSTKWGVEGKRARFLRDDGSPKTNTEYHVVCKFTGDITAVAFQRQRGIRVRAQSLRLYPYAQVLSEIHSKENLQQLLFVLCRLSVRPQDQQRTCVGSLARGTCKKLIYDVSAAPMSATNGLTALPINSLV